MFTRTIALVGVEKFNKLQNSKVLIVGLGGVGGYIAESLVRAGIGTIGLCDFDTVDISNLNRQLLATQDTIGMMKVDAAEKRLKSINPNVNLVKYGFKVTDVSALELDRWDFVADAIDDTKAKLELMVAAQGKIISSMGTGNKVDPFRFRITTIEKTSGDPLARAMRKKLKDRGVHGIPVLFSDEIPYSEVKKPIPTISYGPAVAGLEISSYIIKKILA